jgi:hypothetical protein
MRIGDLVSLASDLKKLASLSGYVVGQGGGTSQAKLDNIRDQALKATLDWVRDDLIKKRIARPWPPSARAYQPPASRTKSLLDSISSKIKNDTGYIYVNPKADKSKGRRLSKYSKYLESGWILRGRPNISYKLPKGRDGNVPSNERNQGISHPGKVQPPRPYMSLPFRYGEVPRIKARYRWELKKRLPPELQYLADQAQLKVEYIPPNLSVLM